MRRIEGCIRHTVDKCLGDGLGGRWKLQDVYDGYFPSPPECVPTRPASFGIASPHPNLNSNPNSNPNPNRNTHS